MKTMKNKKTDITSFIKETQEIMGMMEDVFGHRVTSYSPKDTNKLKNKLTQPISDKEKQDYVDTVEPLMNKKSAVPKGRDKTLDAFVDLDTRISQKDYEPTIDLDTYKKVKEPLRFKTKDVEGGEDGEETQTKK